MIINKTSLSADPIGEMIEDAIAFFLRIYPYNIVCDYDIILCDSFESLEDEWRDYYGFDEYESLPMNYDGQFFAPDEKKDKLLIVVKISEDAITGAQQYLKEKQNGVEEPSEERAAKLISLFYFLELFCHEFSHLCSYDRMMVLTDWADPRLPAHNYDYHLHDEFIARVRGMEIMLRMGAPYMEAELIYSLYVSYMEATREQFEDRSEEVTEAIVDVRLELEEELSLMQMAEGLSDEGMVATMEEELGHKLQYGFVDGKLELSDLEVIEFSLVDELAEELKSYLYAAKNKYAVYEGTQYAGTAVGFYSAFCAEDIGWDMRLENIINIPFWNYLDDEKVRSQNETFWKWFVKRVERYGRTAVSCRSCVRSERRISGKDPRGNH